MGLPPLICLAVNNHLVREVIPGDFSLAHNANILQLVLVQLNWYPVQLECYEKLQFLMLPQLREYQRLSISLTVPVFVLLLPFLHVYSNNVTNLQLPISWFFEDLAKFYIATAIAIYVFLKITPRFIGSWFSVALMFFMVVAW